MKDITNIIAIPRIEKAIQILLDDNIGEVPEVVETHRTRMRMSLGEIPIDIVSKAESELCWLSDGELEMLCTGEVAEQEALPVSTAARWVVKHLFENL